MQSPEIFELLGRVPEKTRASIAFNHIARQLAESTHPCHSPTGKVKSEKATARHGSIRSVAEHRRGHSRLSCSDQIGVVTENPPSRACKQPAPDSRGKISSFAC